MDFPLLIRQRLKELGTEQRDLAAAAQVTESYISQLLTGKKAPPAPERTDIYDRMETFLRLPAGKLATLADLSRMDGLKRRKLADPSAPLSLVTQKLLDVAKRLTKQELNDENWLRLVARLSDGSYEQMRVMVLDFLETDVFNVSPENCVTFLDPLIESWDIDLTTFAMEIVLNRRLAPGHPKKFEFVEREPVPPVNGEPGLQAFLQDPSLAGDATEEEIEFLKKLTFTRNRPTPLYYYRELQSLRDPLHFHRARTDAAAGDESLAARRTAIGVEEK